MLAVLTVFLLVTSCNQSNSTSESTEGQSKVASKSSVVESQDSIINSIHCLDVSFIEDLETDCLNGYKDAKLAKKGFNYESIRNIEHGKERIFKNTSYFTELKVSKIEYPEGETIFIVKYQIMQEQLKCIEDALINSPYFQLNKEKYMKKGLGTYAEKYFLIDSESFWVTFTHRVGKELSLPPIDTNFNSIKRINATTSNYFPCGFFLRKIFMC